MESDLIVADRWDREDLGSVSIVPEFRRARTEIAEQVERGGELLDAVFLVLLKAAPVLVAHPPAGQESAHLVLSMLMGTDSVAGLRSWTVGDPFLAAVGAAELAAVVMALVEELDGLEGEVDGTMAGAVLAAGGEGVDEAVERLCEAAEGAGRAAAAWGIEPGELKRLPVAERLTLADRLDTPRVRRIADLFGRLRSEVFAHPAVAEGGWGDVTDLELGDDLARVAGGELLGLVEPALGDVFLARLAQGELLQLEVTGEDELGRGPIVLCVDGSGTMHAGHEGETREMWAQALKLLLVRLAREQGRALHVVDFGSRNEYQVVSFEGPDAFSVERVLATAGAFYGGGTNFETPLRVAVKLATGTPGADVVFVSDGLCEVPGRVLEGYRASAEQLGMRTWGVLLAARGGFPFTDQVWSIRDLTGGVEVAELVANLSAPTTRV